MTRVAIIAAMPAELKPLTRGWQHERVNGVDLWRHSLDQRKWIAACAGAGVAAATRAFAEVEKLGPVTTAISVGWAGALREDLATGQACDVAAVIDARTGERFLTSCIATGSQALKGHGFSRAIEAPDTDAALAAEGTQTEKKITPQGLKPIASNKSSGGTTRAVPFQSEVQKQIHNELWLVTSSRVADAPEKLRLAETYKAGLVDMEAAAIARLAQMRGIPFYCIKGISDGYNDQLPDFNRFIMPDGQFKLARFIVFALLRPWHWRALIQMGENSRKAAQSIAASLLDFLDERGYIRSRNGYPNYKR